MIKKITIIKPEPDSPDSGRQLINVEYETGESKRFFIDHRPGTKTKNQIFPEYPHDAEMLSEDDQEPIKQFLRSRNIEIL